MNRYSHGSRVVRRSRRRPGVAVVRGRVAVGYGLRSRAFVEIVCPARFRKSRRTAQARIELIFSSDRLLMSLIQPAMMIADG